MELDNLEEEIDYPNPNLSTFDPTEDEKRKALQNLIVNCSELRELERKLGRFNIFRVLGFEEGEIRHSNVFAWLFEPKESHGLGDLFLRRFLMRVVNESEAANNDALSPIEIDAAEIRNVEVRREWQNIDVFLKVKTGHEPWEIVIENKINTKQHSKQLERYRKRVEQTHQHAASRRLFILLSKNEEKPEDESYLTATYTQVYDTLKECMEEKSGSIGTEPKSLLQNYLTLLEERFMENSDIAELAKQIYKSHQLALEVLFEHRPDAHATFTEALRARLDSLSGQADIKFMTTRKSVINFIPASWDQTLNYPMPGNKEWGHVMCQLSFWSNSPIFKIFTNQINNNQWINDLWDKSKSPPFQQHQKRGKQPEKSMTVYSLKSNLQTNDLLKSDSEKSTEKVYKWIEEILESADFKNVSKTISDMISQLHKN